MKNHVIKGLFWLLLSFPAILMVRSFLQDDVLAMDMLHPSGETAVRLMILAMLPGPLSEFFGLNRFFKGWLKIRRNLGVAAFGYAMLHLIFYIFDMNSVVAMLEEFTIPGIWMGWLSLLLMLLPALISFDFAMRRLGRSWKNIQRLVYPALIIGLVHWILLDWAWQPAMVHLAPLMIVWILRYIGRRRRHRTQRSMT
ncbi:ferric reductase-like transmembrane domain-containing protein [Sphingorhabdus sp. 109]|jgi:sulfoxide reductase heme-binding subunit YedZ|uniref:ferric reductase-like transmembrane domain-containing protein n=1 Tax=Sphingorhabdus sp. 109 TaxID=2653173 RepID=UPI0012F1FF01|nr:ferric reductase-like transmembrane domain-containing protein [Sphingorhabdus sp. 109]VWX55809.1 Protein-methionine-sulfoxide reductase heme-binding subunit MsrQ [Sphingorhabdus sp. 109]